MKKIALIISLTASVVLSTNALAAKVEKLVETQNSWNGSQLPAVNTKNPKVTVLRIAIAAGEKLPVHKHDVINVGYLTKGQLTVTTTAGKVYEMKAGDQIVELVGQWHYGQNNGSTEAEIVVVYVGDKETPITTLKK